MKDISLATAREKNRIGEQLKGPETNVAVAALIQAWRQ